MKNSGAYAERFADLINRLRAEFDVPTPEALDPMEQLISGFLMWEATSDRAERAFKRIHESVVDYNELRVCCGSEIVRMIGERYPRSRDRCERLHASLRDIFDREHAMSLERVMAMPNREARAWLSDLVGMVPYVSAQIILLSKGGHAAPVDEQLRRRLIQEEVIDADADVLEAQAWIERQVKASEAIEVHLLLQGWVEDSPPKGRRRSARSDGAGSSRKATRRSQTQAPGDNLADIDPESKR